MNKNKLMIILIVILGLFAIYKIYTFINSKDDKPVVPIEPTSTPIISPTPTIEPTMTPLPTPSPTPVPEDKGEIIYDDIYLKYEDKINTLNPDDNNSVVFSLKGNSNTNQDLYYEILINNPNNNTINSQLSFILEELDDENNVIKTNNLEKYNTYQNRIVYIDKINNTIDKKYKLQVKKENNEKYDDIEVNVKISLEKKELPIKAIDIVKQSINLHSNSTWTDTTDNVIYFSGANNIVNYNYVWYSGKLWRITAINPDGTMRMISESIMTTLTWGKTIEFNGSWVYQWLNEDFYDTLYNPKNLLVTNAVWNYTTDSSTYPKKPETLPNQKTTMAAVGLLSSYEYYNATRNSSFSNNYLNLNHYWWHITPQHDKAMRGTDNNGKQDLYDRNPAGQERGIRPVIYLNKYVEFTGNGTKDNPYEIIGDIETPNTNALLNTRISGEYVSFDNKIYRIVDTYNNTTKIEMVDYLRENNHGIEKHIARTIYYGKPTNTQNEEWWDYYLNNVWYPTINPTYQNMIVEGTYYLGDYPIGVSYKNTICSDSNLDVVTVKNCTKYSDSNHIYVGKVGLIRIGEMFAAQQLDYESSPPTLWTITPFDDIENRIVHESNTLWHHKTWGGYHVVHPTLYLKSTIKIISGNGTFSNPYVISE